MDTITLVEAATHVGRNVRFVAAVQQIAIGKRVLVARQRVQTCHILHVGDASRQFFKITCWGETPPTLIHARSALESEGDADLMQLPSADAALRVGDIVLFSFCRIKSYRGNVEAQFALRSDESTTSTVQLLYRRDRYFSTQDVPLKDLYPMIEWYKQHCREFIAAEGVTSTTMKSKNRATIKDLRENMIASVVFKLRLPTDTAAGPAGGGIGVGSELDGVLLYELIMYDSPRDMMTVNLWDQHAEKRFVARLLEHRGAIEIDGIVVSLQALSNRLLANTTPHTIFRLIDSNDQESIELGKTIFGSGNSFQAGTALTSTCGPVTFSAIEELEGCLFEGHAILENVRVEQICLGRHFSNETRMLAKFAPHLTERYCTGCNQALPEILCRNNTTQSRFRSCPNRCKTRRDSKVNAPSGWRYRRISMILRDSRNERLHAEVNNQAIAEMVGNIEAQVLMEFCENNMQENNSSNTQFDAASAVVSLLNALVEDSTQQFEAQIMCSTVKTRDSQTSNSYPDSSHDDELPARRVFNLTSLTPTDAFSV